MYLSFVDNDYEYYSIYKREFSCDDINRANNGSYFKGKYLCFSSNREDLLKFAIEFTSISNVVLFRLSRKNSDKGDYSYVLSMYDTECRYTIKIENLINSKYPKVVNRYWKSITKTINKLYSQEYLNT